MNKIRSINLWINIKNIIIFLFFIFFTIFISLAVNFNSQNKGYSLFIEFNNAHGIKEGTSLQMRGVNIGYIKSIKIDLNSILVLVHIKSSNILIPRNSIIETNQTGLLNDAVIDIIPLEKIKLEEFQHSNVFSKECIQSSLICHLNYAEGDRGLNYDDLVRAATRISQRFDDPNFFNIFYLFLQNSIELSDDILSITVDISNLLTLMYSFLSNFLQDSI